MAKQTFSVGQVLTAAQMTSLQQTAMLGGAASAKTANYTLVAADAGTAISMSSTSATTITVNTNLFAAGDTVQITNLNTGVCTITAGTATVNTSASLALAQYESGTLAFTSTSAAIFIKGAGAAAASGGMTLLDTVSLSGGSVTSATFSSSYKTLFIYVKEAYGDTAEDFNIRLNADSGSNYSYTNWRAAGGGTQHQRTDSTTQFNIGVISNQSTLLKRTFGEIHIYRPSDTDSVFIRSNVRGHDGTNIYNCVGVGSYDNSAVITSITFISNASNFTAGTCYIYGVA